MLAVLREEDTRGRHCWHAKPWVARILGLDPRFTFEREFIKPHNDYSGATRNKRGKMRGMVLEWLLEEGLYEVQTPTSRVFYVSKDGVLTLVSKDEVIAWIQQSAPSE